jgi:hypothetical protein
LGAAQAAFQSHEETSTLKFLFAASDKSNTTVHRADQRNVQSLMMFHPVLLQSPWETSSTIDLDIIKLLEEKAPLIMARAMPGTGIPTQHEVQLQLTAKQTVCRHHDIIFKVVTCKDSEVYKSHVPCIYQRSNTWSKGWAFTIVYTHS